MWDKINIEDIESVEENSEILKDLILKAKIPKDIEKEILAAFEKLKAKYVAVRSSATAEDSKIDSWAGQLETYLNTTKENLIENIKKCWASL
jgi:pyruvate,water dikinase